MADIIVNNLPLNTTPDLEDVVLLIKNADGTLTRVSMSDIASLIGGGGGSSPSPYTSNPEALGTAFPGSSDNYARGDHVHAMPTASDVGAVAVAQGVAHAGEFCVVGSDGNITTVTMTAWSGGSY